MLQIDHIYEFFYRTIFNKCTVYCLPRGVYTLTKQLKWSNIHVFNESPIYVKILFVDQEPIIPELLDPYLYLFNNLDKTDYKYKDLETKIYYRDLKAIVVSEKSNTINKIAQNQNTNVLYYFFHGFAALDWYRGYYALNYLKGFDNYSYDYIAFNRLVLNDRSYRCYFVSKLVEKNLINKGQVSFGTDTETWKDEVISANTKLSSEAIRHINTWLPTINPNLVIDNNDTLGLASADIPRNIHSNEVDVSAFWHIVTETVFYYNKLHLTEKIFKPIVMKQPFMLLGAPGNLEYLRSYGFKTFEGIIDESYDRKVNPDARIEAVVDQLSWYCNLPNKEKLDVMRAVEPIVEYNFHHFYGEFKHIITTELLENCKDLFKKIGYDDSNIAYSDIYKTLVN